MGRHVGQKTPESRIADLEKRLADLERRQPKSFAISDGTRVRVRLGLQSDGKYGLRVWNAAGTLVVDNTA